MPGAESRIWNGGLIEGPEEDEMRMWITAAVLLGALAVVPVIARAEDPSFAGLISGEPVPDEELARYFGGAVLNFSVSDGSVVTTNAPIDTSQLNTLGTTSVSGGISTITQFQGDYNNVNVTINLSVELNTVHVTGSAGAAVNVNQSLDFGGGVVGGFVQ
jgi:hypothetical protein